MSWKCYMTTLYFKSVSNASEIRDLCVRGDFKTNLAGTDGALTIVKSSLIFSSAQINVAVMKAVSGYLGKQEDIKSSTMKTRSLDTEIVYCLSPSKSITDALKQFGVGDNDEDLCAICVVLVDGDDEELGKTAMAFKHNLVRKSILGHEANENDSTNYEAISKIFGSKALQGDPEKLIDFCTSKTAVKDLL